MLLTEEKSSAIIQKSPAGNTEKRDDTQKNAKHSSGVNLAEIYSGEP